MEPTDIAYIAGILDGEGHLLFADRGRGHGRPRPQMEVSSADEELIEWLLETAGGFRPRTIERGGNRKPEHRWRIGGRKCQSLALLVAPYMRITRKRALAESMQNW